MDETMMSEQRQLKDTLFEHVCLLENKTNEARRQIVKEFLESQKIPYQVQKVVHPTTKEIGCNFVISWNSEQEYRQRIIVLAHHDIVQGAGAANDNSSGVSVLLELIRDFNHNRPKINFNLEFVFTDFEEQKMHGVEHYIKNTDTHSIYGVINLDVCGTGDTVVFDHKNNPENHLSKQFAEVCLDLNIPFAELQRIPPGDDIKFELNQIPSISIAILPSEDVDFIERLAKITHPMWSYNRKNSNFYWRRLLELVKILPKMKYMPKLLKRMHKPTDTSEFISPDALYKAFQCTKYAIMSW